ncbi:hypothetical protein T552_02710 [Pneumocystis carinii B80]|uniref:Sld7 C-terminal domain-containing protein n=1 Tax=Pneumocystis carinii (strain B80) TaxID=1408658 RepID=A0A0W4ZE98_PNEC8|nr:hypothetical protein T552_02710 [Pneumocystis carinii B80]KTW26704.1 hypothetical protein T552_02710 [Pneumocystis carinii B80]
MSKIIREKSESKAKCISKISNILSLLIRRLPVKLKTKNWHGHFCLEPISFENIHENQENTIDLLDKNSVLLVESSLLSANLVANVQTCNIPFWKCLGPQLQVCAADKHIKAYFKRWESKRSPSGDSLSGWVLQWSDGTRALLYGHSLPGQPLRILCTFFNPGNIITPVTQKNKQSLQRLIMAALRLRGIERTHEEFKQLYQHIWMATIFACRQNINQQWIPIDKQQWIVERFVETFLLEEIPS